MHKPFGITQTKCVHILNVADSITGSLLCMHLAIKTYTASMQFIVDQENFHTFTQGVFYEVVEVAIFLILLTSSNFN